MAKENIEKFEQLLVSDEELQAKYRAAMDAYTGDKQDEKAVFDAVVGLLAEEAGLPFTFEEAEALALEGREVSLDEADDVAGGEDIRGEGVCFVIGINDGKEVDSCSYQNNEQMGDAACAYVGVGIAMWR